VIEENELGKPTSINTTFSPFLCVPIFGPPTSATSDHATCDNSQTFEPVVNVGRITRTFKGGDTVDHKLALFGRANVPLAGDVGAGEIDREEEDKSLA